MRPRYAHTNGVTENSASLTRRRLYAGAGECRRRRSAAHVRRCVCPRRCRGLTEGVTACAVGLRLWSSGVPPARRQQGRVKSRHAALRSAYRVMAECRRSATMSADVCGDDGVARPLARSGSDGVEVAHLRCAVGLRSGRQVARAVGWGRVGGLSGGERRVDQENVVGGTCERRV